MDNKKQTSANSIENLKQLAKIYAGGEIKVLLREIKLAKQNLNALYTKINEKKNGMIRQEEINNDVKEHNNKVAPKTSNVAGAKPQNRATQANKPQGNRPPRKDFSKPKFDGKKPFNNYKGTANNFNNAPNAKKFGNDSPKTKEASFDASKVKNKFANSANKTKDSKSYDKKQKYNKKQLLRRGLVEEKSIEERMVARRLKVKRPKQDQATVIKKIENAIITTDNITVKLLAEKIGKPVADIVKKLFLLGIMATINSNIDYDTAELIASDLGITLERKVEKSFEEKLEDEIKKSLNEEDDNLQKRPPIVTVMGHVDHGKTSLLDAIRQTNITGGEAGGITQHIGAYTVKTKKGQISFIDTPGHAAFTEMRARGAKVTDVAILVVAADDGIMPQTVEAINHIKAAGVPMVVAINKIDKVDANPEKIKQQLSDHNVLPEEWGGDTICVNVSAHTKEGIDKLLEMLILVADMQELKANPNKEAIGTIIEAKLDKGKGPVATIVIGNGTLNVGDTIVSGVTSGRIRAMMDENGKKVKSAGPSMPVSVLGFDEVPQAGDIANVVEEKMAKQLVEERRVKQKQLKTVSGKAVNLEDLFSKVKEGALKNLNLIIKSGVMGTVEALKQSLEKLKNEEVKVNVIHGGAGAVTENDVLLAQASNAIIIGFNVRPNIEAKKLAEKHEIDIRFYKIIYNVIDDIEAAMKGMLAPKFEEVILGHAEVRVLYKISRIGTIAGCMVLDGKIIRNASVRLLRENVVITESSIETLKMQKDDVKEAKSGFECGIKLKGFNDIKEGDVIEAFEDKQIEVK